MENNYKYFAFISYKRGGVDGMVANWIHSKLEKYPYPSELVSEENRPSHDSLIRRVFIDVKDLRSTEHDFTDDIKSAIKSSRYLLVVCSKLASQSEYISKEVSYFLETHDNDTSKILPIFIDSVENALPAPINNSHILSRHCPVYSSMSEPKNEVNLYCFYHIVAFLLKIDFHKIYDRYRLYKEKKYRQKQIAKAIFFSLITIAIILLSFLAYSQSQSIKRQNHIVKLEKEIFPYSVVTGYVENFILPTIEYLKVNEPDAHIYIYMPTSAKDIDHSHRDRFDYTLKYIADKLTIDSINQVKLKTRMPRGSILHKMYSSPDNYLNGSYIDFASTTSTFLAIALKKKENPAYSDIVIDEVINEYTQIFIQQANELVAKSDSSYTEYITFVKKLDEINHN